MIRIPQLKYPFLPLFNMGNEMNTKRTALQSILQSSYRSQSVF